LVIDDLFQAQILISSKLAAALCGHNFDLLCKRAGLFL